MKMTAKETKDSHRPPTDSGIAKEEFIRVRTTLYKLVNQPRLNGGYVKKRIVWNNETLRQDYGKHYLATVPKYDGFCTVPEHVNYQPVVGTFLNLYEPIDHQPQEGDFPFIRSLVEHIFGEQYELGMDYLQLLYLQPIQKLPILLLVSEERNTGKSTFLNFLKALFQNNVTFNTNEDFRSQFNSDWAGKLLIVVDEVLLSRREDSERLKNLSTTLSYKVEAKGKDRDEIAFFAKFVLCSNNEYLPVVIDPGETRYWVRKIPKLTTDDTTFLEKIRYEIPAFLHALRPKWFPVFFVLSRGEAKTITSIAREIGHSHPSVSNIVKEMGARGLVKEKKDKTDGRRNLVMLSAKGKKMSDIMAEQYPDVEAAVEQISSQTRNDLWRAIEEWEGLLAEKTLLERVKEAKKEREGRDVSIVPYDPRYRAAFKALNEEWITAHWQMEEPDHHALDHPQEHILDKGGHIFVALYREEPVGVCALCRKNDPVHQYELAKLAVSPSAQGKGIGMLLCRTVIAKAKELGCKKIFLESNTLLRPAIQLYRKAGFREVEIYRPSYERVDIQMELALQ